MRIMAKDIIRSVAGNANVAVKEMYSPSRYRSVAWPRQEAMFLIYVNCPHYSYPMIGRIIGRDHTTVLHGVRRYCERSGISYERAKEMRRANAEREAMTYGVSQICTGAGPKIETLKAEDVMAAMAERYLMAMRSAAA